MHQRVLEITSLVRERKEVVDLAEITFQPTPGSIGVPGGIFVTQLIRPPGTFETKGEVTCIAVGVNEMGTPVRITVGCIQLKLGIGNEIPSTRFVGVNSIRVLVDLLKIIRTGCQPENKDNG